MTAEIEYIMTLTATEASTGFFACIPRPAPDLGTALLFLRQHPLDTFMYRHTLGLLGQTSLEDVRVLQKKQDQNHPVIDALVREAALSYPHLSSLGAAKASEEPACLFRGSPLTTLRAVSRPFHDVHHTWNQLLAANLNRHCLLPDAEQAPRPFPYDIHEVVDPGGVYITQVLSQLPSESPSVQAPSAEETAELALERLKALDILEGAEMRHQSSLSPYGLLHKWRLALSVDLERHNYTLSGIQTSYGRGLTLAAARASYAMEIVERCSSFATIGKGRVLGCLNEHRIYHGAYSALREKGLSPIDPNGYGIDVPYNDEPLYWITGVRRTKTKEQSVLVPVQCVYLFSNLDEIDLFSGHGSTGLASGNTLAEAKLSALMELVERDGEATHPFHHSLCFHITARDDKVAALLDDYRGRGICFQFQDISPPYGIPCCKCFVSDVDGNIAKGAAANLNGRRAVISALTETPYPYPYGPPSGPGLLQLPELYFEELPDYSSTNSHRDLALVETLLLANGIEPVYVDMTRNDLQLPVIRALLPGFALTADLDPNSRVHPRLFANYLKIFGK